MDEEEQVVGVVKFCDVCGEKTVFVNGVCREHEVVRQRKQAAFVEDSGKAVAVATAVAPPPPRKKKKPKSRFLRNFVSLVILAALIFAFGSIRVVRSAHYGYAVCLKDQWSLAHTMLDLDIERSAGRTPLKTRDWCGVGP